MPTVLIIDDEEKIRSLLSKIIALEGFEVFQASNLKSGLKRLEISEIDVIICDVKLPDGSGVDFAQTISTRFPNVEVILLTAYGNIPDGVQAIKNGAFDYITEGDDNHKIIPLLNKAMEKVQVSKRKIKLQHNLGSKKLFESIIGKSTALRNAIESAKKVAETDATVLLTGETGTGKEVFAQAIHNASKRSKANFIAINCSAFSKDLLENELFGHKAGAFTGALKDSKGIFEEANNGTVFLDELGEMPLDLQAKLLRVLESGEFLKVGDNKPTKVNVRIITATNRNLLNEVEAGNFRDDLYYRIAVFQINLPSLRDRISDIENLALHFLEVFAKKAGRTIDSMSEDYLKALQNHDWKGNIRELRNIIERSVILTDGSELLVDSLPFDFANTATKDKNLPQFSMANAEKVHIQKILQYTKGNKAETARLLEIGIANTSVSEIVDYALLANRSAADQKKIKIDVTIDENSQFIHADSEKTAWILNNLLSNAIRYSHENAAIIIEVKPLEGKTQFTVKDFGRGIEAEYHNKIFSRYFRVPGTKRQGTGLGLSISKELVEAQGGKIWVESELGSGSTFGFLLG